MPANVQEVLAILKSHVPEECELKANEGTLSAPEAAVRAGLSGIAKVGVSCVRACVCCRPVSLRGPRLQRWQGVLHGMEEELDKMAYEYETIAQKAVRREQAGLSTHANDAQLAELARRMEKQRDMISATRQRVSATLACGAGARRRVRVEVEVPRGSGSGRARSGSTVPNPARMLRSMRVLQRSLRQQDIRWDDS